ncbi:hypothetical protein CCH79_00019226 [Gambusia affinis]|uniref:26S proteasome non-ATPase regulatory subunit 3 n=1 Tax=Gambusia affinis TaxID=33528 RepID=A0A315VVW1_GAMAF|nr:hypothetical protein CCH79_00019226 [Gambusia affinis]
MLAKSKGEELREAVSSHLGSTASACCFLSTINCSGLHSEYCPVIVRISFSCSQHRSPRNRTVRPKHSMKETAAKRRDKAGGRDRDKSNKEPKDPKEAKSAMAAAEPQDVEMPEEETTNAVKLPKEQDSLTLEDIKEHVKQIEKAVSGKEPRFVLRALRALPSTSRRLNTVVLQKALTGFFTSNTSTRDFLLGFLEEPMETGDGDIQFRPRTGKAASTPLLPEVEAYLQLLLVVHLTNSKRYTEAQKVSDELMQKVSSKNRRALDLVVAKCYYYHARVYEFLNQLDTIRSFLHTRLRTATLRHDADGQAVLLNLLLRNYLHFNLYDQAEKLVSKSVFPELANNNEWARYLYYTGRIKAIQLEYTEARRTLTNALRKAPQHTAVGFKQTNRGSTPGSGSETRRYIRAIRDGVIEASINHEKGFVQSKEMMDIYGTREPQLAFHQRISFCLDIHNMSVKAMRFPPKAYNKDLESAEERREREQQDLEFAKEMAEDDDDSFP